jgi:hypothetical protein
MTSVLTFPLKNLLLELLQKIVVRMIFGKFKSFGRIQGNPSLKICTISCLSMWYLLVLSMNWDFGQLVVCPKKSSSYFPYPLQEPWGGGSGQIRIADLIENRNKLNRIFVRGWTQYTDAEKHDIDSYRTEFCFEIFCLGDPYAIDCYFKWTFHLSHNKTDNDISRLFNRINPKPL